MKKKSLSVIGKIFTSIILTCYSFAPSVMAIDDIVTTDNSQDILDVGVSDPTWITNGNSSVTSNVVVLGETYVAPQNSDVTVTFTKLPSNPSTLSINEITLTNEEMETTGAVSNKAYDINTSMMDGTFEYDLTLPSSSDNTKVVYAENRSELLNNVQEVNNTVVDQGDTVKVEDLNHFTIYIVSTTGSAPTVSAGSVNNATSVTLKSGASITVKLNVTMNGGENWKSTGYQIGTGTWQCANTTDYSGNGTYNNSFIITAPSTDGTYNLNLKAYSKSSCSTSGGSVSAQYTMPNAIVVDNSVTPPVLVDNPLDKYAMTSVTGIWTSISGGSGYSGLNTNEVRWGTPAGATKSGLKFTNSGAQSFNEGNTFYLGMLTHMNWGTQAGTAATGATLQITLDFNRPDIANQVLTYNFAIEETSNGYDLYYCPAYQISDTPCDDKVTFPNSYGTQVFVIDDVQYTLVIDGFVSEYPSGSALSAFITEEQKDNSAFLVGHLSSVLVERPAISIIKKTNNQDIATAPGNNLYVGDSVTWQYVVQNTGNTTLNNITVTDNPAETITCPTTTLASGASMTCTASGTVTLGQFTNTATVRSGALSASDTSYYNGISRSHLIVQKTTLPAGDATLFNINAAATTGTIFGATTGTISDSTDKDYSVSAGTYSVTETVPAGWGQTSNTCTNVTVGVNETKTCTIVNQKLPTLTIEKVLVGDSTPLNNFSYKVDGGTAVPFEADGSNTIFVVPGSSYAITEVNPGSSFNVTYSSGCNGNLTYGQSATCTITNTKYASLTIVKDANPNSSQSFGFTASGTGLSNFSLTDDGSVFGSNTKTFTNLLPATYSVTENAVSGWDSTASCTDGSLNTAINISAGESVTCTFVNVLRGAIGGHKYNDADGDYATNDRTGVAGWTIELYKNNVKIADTTTDINGAFGFSNLIPGAYQLREALTVGWYKIYPTTDYLDVTLLPGQNNFGNDFINVKYPTITVLKNVDTNADGVVDTTGATDWTWDINGSGNNLTGSTVSVNPGTYTISEDQKANYHATDLTCNGTSYGAVESQSVTLTSGQDLVCIFTNTRDTGTLRVVKNVVNDNGGILSAQDFTFVVDSGAPVSFETDGSNDLTKYAGGITYNITEPAVAGYATTYDNCTDVTVPVNGVATCTITNNDIAPTLKLVKNVVNDNGGNAVANDWDLTATGTELGFTDKGDSTTVHTVKAGVEYTLTESNVAGYTATNLSCTGGSLSENKLTLGLDEDVVCTVTNDDIAPTITLTKAVVNDNGGEATSNDFGLTIGGTSVTSGQTLSVNSNEAIALNEAGLFGYSFVSITGDTKCPNVLGGTVTLDEGENIACTIANNDIAPQLTVVKHVVNNTDDTNSVAGDFQMMVSGTNVSNPSFAGSEAGTTLTLNAGTYGVTETYNTSDYTQSIGDNCSGTIGIGESKTCTITNTDIDHLPTIEVNKVADDNAIPETGQNVTFTYTVKNTSSESVDITYLNDSIFGTIDGNDTCKVETTLAPNASCSFTLTKFISGDAGSANHENVFVARAQDDETNTAVNQDNEIISFDNVNPDITVTKTASIESIPETGGNVTFTFTVQNNTAESVSITQLVDDKFGDLAGDSDCYVGAVLSGNSSCSFAQEFSIPAGVAPAIHTNEFTATVMDDEEHTDSDSATASVSLTYVPTLKLIKSVVNGYNSNGNSSDWTLYATGDKNGFSVAGGEGGFHVVTPGQAYVLSEEGLNGYTASQWSCDKEGVLDGSTVTLAAEDDVTCTITNTAQPGTITVYKDVVDSEGNGDGVYSDTDFNVTLNGDLTNVKAINDTKDGQQTATFSNLDTGFYSISELQKDGFLSLGCYARNSESSDLPRTADTSTFYVGNGENIEVVCKNQVIAPELQIAKANNAGGTGLVAGSNVLYTLIVTAPESQDDGGNYIIENVKVVDLPPAGIKYQVGSWTAVSNIRGNLKALGITTEPTYASPGKWNLGEMLEGEVVTLTYVGNISSTLDAGKYKDLAWTEGTTLTDDRTLGKAATGFFASTNVNITEPVEQGQVLGITDEQTLPDTGASTMLTIGAVISMILGSIFLIFNPKKKMMKVLGLSVVALVGITSLVMPTKAYADSGDLAVEIEQPKTPYSESSFQIGFVALDIQSRNIAVQCYETTHGAFGPEYTLNTIGNSGNCVVDSSVITADGTYEFYIVAKAGTDEVTSDKVSVVIDLVGPAPVVNYTKTVASCTNNLQFTTANDGQTTKIQIFRSDKATFTADSSTLIKEITAGPNQLVTYSDTQPVCGQTYFYAVRALDIADNTSTFVTDKTVVVTLVPVTPTTPVTPTVVPIEEVKGTETTEPDTSTPVQTTDNEEEVKGVTDDETKANVWDWLKYVLIGVGALTIISITYVYAKNRKREQEIK
jgi:uncharacterized repeat protein (TIGR01451 family)